MPAIQYAVVTQQKYEDIMLGHFEKRLADKANRPKLRSQEGTLLEGIGD